MQPTNMTLRALRRLALQNFSSPTRLAVRAPSSVSRAVPRCAIAAPRFIRPYSTPADSNSGNATTPVSVDGQSAETPLPKPTYELHFTCKPCGHRSKHNISKQGYHHGSVLVQCPNCKNRHVISDHLGVFLDQKMTIEDLMRERGQLVKKGSLSQDGDLEFWEDGTTTPREKSE